MIGYLNVNHFENKITNFREICHQAPIDIIYVNEANISFLIDFLLFAEIDANMEEAKLSM